MPYARLQQIAYPTERWESVDPVLNKHELGFEEVSGSNYIKAKMGDGTSKWSELPYIIDWGEMAAALETVEEAADTVTAAQEAAADAQEAADALLEQVNRLSFYVAEDGALGCKVYKEASA